MTLYLGIDFGTSGARGIVIDEDSKIRGEIRLLGHPDGGDGSSNWRATLWELLGAISQESRRQIRGIAINGTSSTVLLTDAMGEPVCPPLLYNDGRGSVFIKRLAEVAPPNHTVLSATSTLAKLLWMQQLPTFSQARYLLHQADWLGFLLHGKLGFTDYHNALKLGYDVEELKYPKWLEDLKIPVNLPRVLTPGERIGELIPGVADRFGLRRDCWVCAGTTDSIAAFLASGAKLPGEAVTSLGSTLVLKLLSRTRIEDARYGVYSHRLGNLWLAGGASNTGGAVLKKFFTDEELVSLSQQIDGCTSSQLDYYPLLQPGDRFPVNDPMLAPRLDPRPEDPREFLHGLLEGMARIEQKGYSLLQQLGADKLIHVYTAGGGAVNSTWTAMRKRFLKTNVIPSTHTEAAYGTALLAMGLPINQPIKSC
ncbi:MAG: FGGY-family carbohydrate kinase [Cylindrospermopsis raciborskii KL1]|jgi:sugar (pentulose or hexulose) kinase|uniref:FGGY-family carbohydrate kinase n=1 Tax=Cylindrospermopsis raciborskii TaxID=77022 RepID=UPI001A2D6B42|nr:FGGY-family carbohydrate kinase [Cylindrospermopsis raciborskii]MBG0742036.1 FGGY-family carbohydrate kinase [Cylindrospermopsis raciborskii KL1]